VTTPAAALFLETAAKTRAQGHDRSGDHCSLIRLSKEEGVGFVVTSNKSPIEEPTPPMRVKNITQRFPAFAQNLQGSDKPEKY